MSSKDHYIKVLNTNVGVNDDTITLRFLGIIIFIVTYQNYHKTMEIDYDVTMGHIMMS